MWHSWQVAEQTGRQPGSPGNRQAAQYLEDQFRAVGLQPLPSLGGYRQPIAPQIGDNLIGFIPPTAGTGSARWLVIGAHYDHLGYPFLGADDNASSIAILLETARHMGKPFAPWNHLCRLQQRGIPLLRDG